MLKNTLILSVFYAAFIGYALLDSPNHLSLVPFIALAYAAINAAALRLGDFAINLFWRSIA